MFHHGVHVSLKGVIADVMHLHRHCHIAANISPSTIGRKLQMKETLRLGVTPPDGNFKLVCCRRSGATQSAAARLCS
jgi:hypothetical protein